ncbi:uncharacterized protein LOC135397584 [Ornithodoros turicata]|uniref:uncharacterized protein LOC135397584 n=1 Tax=Ornithodoros turicata TaxID=34597 RepID=UPI0031387F32
MDEPKNLNDPPNAVKPLKHKKRRKKTPQEQEKVPEPTGEPTAAATVSIKSPRSTTAKEASLNARDGDDVPSPHLPIPSPSQEEGKPTPQQQEPSPHHTAVAESSAAPNMPSEKPAKSSLRGSVGNARTAIHAKKGADVRVNVAEQPLLDVLRSERMTEGTSRIIRDPSGPQERRKSSVRFGETTYREIEVTAEEKLPHVPSRFAVFFSVLLITCIGLLLYILYVLPPPTKRKMAVSSVTGAYHDAAAYLDNITDNRIDPCLDFFGHVCSSWTSEERDINDGFLQDARSALLKKMNQTLIETNTVSPDRYGTHVFYGFYKSCYDFMMSPSKLSEPPYTTFARHFGKLEDFLSTPYSSVLSALIRVSLERGVDSVFGVRLVTHGAHSNLLITRTRSIQEKLSGHKSDRNVDNYVMSVLHDASADKFSATEYRQKAMSLDDEVRVLFESDEAVIEIDFADVKELTNEITEETWMKTVNDVLPARHKVAPQAKIITRGFNATRGVFKLLEDMSMKPDSKLKTIYLYLQLLAEVLYLDYRRRFSRLDTIHTCMEASQKVLVHSWPYLFSTMSTAHNSSATINNIYEDVSDVVASPRYLSWMNRTTQLTALSKVKNVTLTPLPTAPSIDVDSNYTTVLLGEFFVNGYITLLAEEHTMLLKFPPDAEHILLDNLLLDGPLSYYEPLSSVIVPTVYRVPPVLYSRVGVPEYFDASTVGILMAVELSRVIGPSAGASWWSSDTKENFDQSFQCLMNMYERMAPESSTDKMRVAEAIFAWTRAVRVVYDMLRTRRRGSKSSPLMTTEAHRVFFKRFCLLSCRSDANPRPLTPRQQCTLPLLNMPEFSEVFQCAQGLGASAHVCKIL